MEPVSKPRPRKLTSEPKSRSRSYGSQRYRDYQSSKEQNSGLGLRKGDRGTSDEGRLEAIIGHEKMMEVISLIESEGSIVTIPESQNPNSDKQSIIEQARKDQIEKILGCELAEKVIAILPANSLRSRAATEESMSSSDSTELLRHFPIISQIVNTGNGTAVTELYARCTPASEQPFMSIRRDTLDNGTVIELVHYSAEYAKTLESPCNPLGIQPQGLTRALNPLQLLPLVSVFFWLTLAVLALVFELYVAYRKRRKSAKGECDES
jgi:hypothetical protein